MSKEGSGVGSGPSEAQFLDAFDGFVRAVRRARGNRDDDGLTLSQYGLLEPLREQAQVRVRELADRAGVTAPTATSILGTLERRGIVIRAAAADDRRGILVSLTDHGRDLLIDRHCWLIQQQRQMFARLDPTERTLAPELLDRLAELIDRMAAGPSTSPEIDPPDHR